MKSSAPKSGLGALRVAASVVIGALVLAAVLLGRATPAAAQNDGGTGLFPPTTQDLQTLWSEIDTGSRAGDWDAVVEKLEEMVTTFDLAPGSDPGKPVVNSVVSNDAGVSLGIRALLSRYVRRLPKPYADRFLGRVDTLIARGWNQVADEPFASARRRLRHEILRDHPGSEFLVEALEEEIDDRLLSADWRHARRAVERRFDLDRSGRAPLTLEDRLRSLAILLQVDQALGDEKAWKAHQDALAKAAEEVPPEGVEEAPAAGSEPDSRNGAASQEKVVSTEIQRLVERALGSSFEALIPEPEPAAERAVLNRESGTVSPFLDPGQYARAFAQASSDGLSSSTDFRLGTAIWRRQAGDQDLRRFIETRREERDGVVTRSLDVPIPFHASVSAGRIVMQHDRQVIAFDLVGSRQDWLVQLASSSGSYSVPRTPLCVSGRCLVTQGNEIVAIDIENGEWIWSRFVEYFLSDATLRVVTDSSRDPASERPDDLPPRAPTVGPGAIHESDVILPVHVRSGKQILCYLVRIDLEGNAVWTTFVGSTANTGYLGLGASPSPPRIVDDRLIHLTNLGFLVSVDPVDGVIQWIKEHETLSSRGQLESIRDENRWQPNPLVRLDDEHLLVAPQQSTRLLAVRVDSGATTWHCRREEHSTLIGHDDRHCFVAGSRLSAIALKGPDRGKAVWSRSLGDDVPQGRALLVPGRILVSSRDALVQLDPSTGRTLARHLWDFPGAGGNLVLLDGRVAVIHPGGFILYETFDVSRQRIERSPKKDATYWLELARLRLRSDDVAGGLAALEEWSSGKPTPPQPNSPLDRLHMSVSDVLEMVARNSDPNSARRILKFRLKIESEPTRRVNAAIELGLFLESLSGSDVEPDLGAAVAAYHQALEFDIERATSVFGTRDGRAIFSPQPGATMEKALRFVDGFFPIDAESFVRHRIRAARQRSRDANDGDAFGSVEESASAALSEARKRGTLHAFGQMLRRYPFTRAAALAYADLSAAYLDHGNTLQAARALLKRRRDFPDIPDNLRYSLLAAQLLYRGGKRAEAKSLYGDLLATHKESVVNDVPGIEPGEPVGQYIERRLKDPGLAEVEGEDIEKLRTPLEMIWRAPADLESADEKRFLRPTGSVPTSAMNCFFTQTSRSIQCRELATGIPRYTVNLTMIPGFHVDEPRYSRRFVRSGIRQIRGRFVGELLVLHDHKNIFAVDHASRKVRWNVPFEDSRPAGARRNVKPGARLDPSRAIPALSEQLRGVRVTDRHIFATTSRRRLLCFDLGGRQLWERELEFDPSTPPPITSDGEVFVISQLTTRYHGFTVQRGSPSGKVFDVKRDRRFARRIDDPIELDGGHVLMPLSTEVQLIHLPTRRVVWTFSRSPATIERVFHSRQAPGEVMIVTQEAGKWALVGVRIAGGEEDWRYENFSAGARQFWVQRDGDQLFVLHGGNQLEMVGLETRRIPGQIHSNVATLWPHRDIRLGNFFSRPSRPEIHVGENALFFPEPSPMISVFDRVKGTILNSPSNPLSTFLVEKRSYRTAVVGRRLVVLTDGGDCAFRGASSHVIDDSLERRMTLVEKHVVDRADVGTIVELALSYFRAGDFKTATGMLDRALRSEELLSTALPEEIDGLAFLLEGLHQEAMKTVSSAEITARFLVDPPTVDGQLDDSWSYAHRTLVTGPRNLNLIPAPGRRRQWEGEEDLSAVLYTGWDEGYFYFALDVDDDVLRAFDRDAEYWRGDCLLIGLDPNGDGGYQQGSDDQLMTLALTIPKRKKGAKNPDDDDRPENGDDDDDDDDDDDGARRPEGQFSVKKKDDNSGAIYEVAFPWTSFPRFSDGPPPERGFGFGLSLLLTDDDSGRGATKTLSINPCHLIPRKQRNFYIWRHMIPEFFPRIRLR